MTHHELTRGRGGYHSDCPGGLRSLGSFPDPEYGPGPPSRRRVEVWCCDLCGRRVSETGGRVLNSYEWPERRGPLVDTPTPAPSRLDPL